MMFSGILRRLLNIKIKVFPSSIPNWQVMASVWCVTLMCVHAHWCASVMSVIMALIRVGVFSSLILFFSLISFTLYHHLFISPKEGVLYVEVPESLMHTTARSALLPRKMCVLAIFQMFCSMLFHNTIIFFKCTLYLFFH